MHKGKVTRLAGQPQSKISPKQPRELLGRKPRAPNPYRSQDLRARAAPGPSFQWNRRGWGREGAEARVQVAATKLRLISLPGVFRLGEVHPEQGTRQAGGLRRAGRAMRGPGCPERMENPMERGTWQATVRRVAKSQTKLKQLSMHARAHTHTYMCT